MEHKLLLKHNPAGLRSSSHFPSVELIPQAEEVRFLLLLKNIITSQSIVQYRGLGAPICQVQDDMTAALVEPSSRISLPP